MYCGYVLVKEPQPYIKAETSVFGNLDNILKISLTFKNIPTKGKLIQISSQAFSLRCHHPFWLKAFPDLSSFHQLSG